MANPQTGFNLDGFADLITGLSFREDDFSRQISVPDDPLFWWRVESGDPGTLRFTDFKSGDQPDDMMVFCLSYLLEGQDDDGRLAVEFFDIVPQDLEPAQHRIKVTTRVAQIERWIAAAVESLHASYSDPQLSTVRGKICLTTELEGMS
ncbi:MAG: hypothetical protein AAF636_25235 [Pseudomonadota bacterium]